MKDRLCRIIHDITRSRKPLERSTFLRMDDQVLLDQMGDLAVYRDGHVYRAKGYEEGRRVTFKYLGSTSLVNPIPGDVVFYEEFLRDSSH